MKKLTSKKYFDVFENKLKLEKLTSDRYLPVEIADMLDISLTVLRSELQRGMTWEDYKKRKYTKYSAVLSAYTTINEYKNAIEEIELEMFRAIPLEVENNDGE